jgi:hypothetical protein
LGVQSRIAPLVIAGSVLLASPSLRAEEAVAKEPVSVTVAQPPPPKPGKFFAHANVAFNVYTYLGPTGNGMGAAAEQHIHPGNRAILFQQLGFGYFFHKMLRVQLTFQVGETLSGLPAGKDTVALFGIIPWLVFAHKGFVTGIGPILAPISANTVPRFDAGIFTATGYTFKLPKGFSIGALMQVVFFFRDRTTIAVSPAVIAGYRF